MVELEPQPQQQSALQHPGRDRRVADRAEQDRVVPADLLEDAVGQRLAGRVPAARAQVVGRAVERESGPLRDDVENLQGLLGDFRADAVGRDDREE